MKGKALLTAILLAASNFAWATAGGGLDIDQVREHTDANNGAQTQTERDYIMTQGSIDKFDVEAPKTLVDTDQFKNTNNGQV